MWLETPLRYIIDFLKKSQGKYIIISIKIKSNYLGIVLSIQSFYIVYEKKIYTMCLVDFYIFLTFIWK